MEMPASLPVPSVQELVIQGFDSVPHRYLQHDVDPSHPSLQVPLIDMAKLLNNHQTSINSCNTEFQNFISACKHWGVFQIINHGVDFEAMKKMSEQVKGFFELTSQEKNQWAQKPGDIEGYGQAFITSPDQKLEWNDMLFLKVLPIHSRNMGLWPLTPKLFREALISYGECMRSFTVSLIKLLAKGLQLESEQLSSAYEKGLYTIRMSCYPSCPEPDRVIGIKPHCDISGVSLLFECGDIAGLQAQKDGNWVSIEPIDGAIVVTIGHIMEIMSNGIYKAAEHRAVVNKVKERHSIVTFCYPDSSSLQIGPAEGLIDGGMQSRYRTISLEEYFRIFSEQVFSKDKFDSSFIDSLKM